MFTGSACSASAVRCSAGRYTKTEKAGPLQAVVMGAQETWFVVERTLSYIGGVFTGREVRPISSAALSALPGFPAEVATAGFVRPLIHLTRRAVGSLSGF